MEVREKGKFDWIKNRSNSKLDQKQDEDEKTIRNNSTLKENAPFNPLAGGLASPRLKRKTSLVEMLSVQDEKENMKSKNTMKTRSRNSIIKREDFNYEEELIIEDMDAKAYLKKVKFIPNSQPVNFVLKGKEPASEGYEEAIEIRNILVQLVRNYELDAYTMLKKNKSPSIREILKQETDDILVEFKLLEQRLVKELN